jgi:hypothetical protein
MFKILLDERKSNPSAVMHSSPLTPRRIVSRPPSPRSHVSGQPIKRPDSGHPVVPGLPDRLRRCRYHPRRRRRRATLSGERGTGKGNGERAMSDAAATPHPRKFPDTARGEATRDRVHLKSGLSQIPAPLDEVCPRSALPVSLLPLTPPSPATSPATSPSPTYPAHSRPADPS